MTIVYRALRPSEREECLELWLTVWPGENNRAYFEKYFSGDIEWLPYYTQVAESDGRLVSAVHICKRVVACGEFSLTMGGIANVATLPEYRGRGYNSACLKNAIEVMEADAMDFALLFTGINAYYRRFGFEDLPRVRTTAKIRPDYRAQSSAPSARSAYSVRANTTADMPAIQSIYDTYNSNRPIAVQRSEAYWRDWLRFDPEQSPSRMLVACDQTGDIAGYVILGAFSSAVPYDSESADVNVIELCTACVGTEAEEVVSACLLNEVIDGMPLSQSRTLNLEIPVTPAVGKLLAHAAGPEGIEHSRVHSAMVRLLHRDNLLHNVCMFSSERWQDSGTPAGKLVFQTPYGPVGLDASGALPRVTDPEAGGFEVAASIPMSDLFGLLFGSLTPSQVTDRTVLCALLSMLFPRRDEMVFWGADGF